jgi:hypothetical protein
MGVKMKSGFIFILLVCFLCAAGYAQKKDPVEELANRVKILEGQKENLDKQGDLLHKKFEAKAKDLDLKIEEIRLEQKKNNWIFPVLLFIIPFIGVGGFLGLKKYINKKAREEADKIINNVFPEKEKEFLELAKKQTEEFQLKKDKSILVISNNQNEDPFIERFFSKMGFANVHYETLKKVKNANKYDLLLFNNEKQTSDHADLLAVIAKTKPDVFCFYFGPDRFDGKEFKDRVNFANSRVQLYGNLINSLRYQSLLK